MNNQIKLSHRVKLAELILHSVELESETDIKQSNFIYIGKKQHFLKLPFKF